MRKITIILLFAVILSRSALCQLSLSSSGGKGTGTTGSFSYTAGQVDYITLTGATGTAAAGVQQPFIISSSTGTGYNEINLKWIAYPNPVDDNLTLETGSIITDDLSYELADMYGRDLRNAKIASKSMVISFSGVPPGTYFLRIFLAGKEIKIFKIVKL